VILDKKNEARKVFNQFIKIVFYYAICFLIIITLLINGVTYLSRNQQDQQFVDLARSFIQGKLYFIYPITPFSTSVTLYKDAITHGNFDQYKNTDTFLYSDSSFYKGRWYWPLGPFPSILMLPVVFLADTVGFVPKHDLLNSILFLVIAICFYYIAKKNGFKKHDAIILASGFCFGSVLYSMALSPSGWYFAHIVTTALIVASLLEYWTKRRPVVIGILMGLVVATRMTAGLGLLFFMAADCLELYKNTNVKIIFKRMLYYCIPFAISLVVLAIYNYFRFDSFFDKGYSLQSIRTSLAQAKSYGLLSFIHLPGNLYYAFLSMPTPVFKDQISHVLKYPFIQNNPWGISIFFTSPYLISLFFFDYKKTISKLLIGISAVVAIPVFLYYGIGFSQVGYRYALDFLPFLFTLFMIEYKEKRPQGLSMAMQAVLIMSGFIVLYLNVAY